jgi:preprotein translocase subunit YajC
LLSAALQAFLTLVDRPMNYPADLSAFFTLAQSTPQAGAAPAPAAPVQAVGMPGAPTGGATTGANGAATVQPAPTPAGGGASMMLWLPLVVLLVLVMSTFMGGRREQKRRAAMLSSIEKHDKVQTSGGIIGTVVEMGEHDMVLRVEEGRIRIAKVAVTTVLHKGHTRTAGTISEPKNAAPQHAGV